MFVVTTGHGPLALPETMSIISRLRPPHPSGGTPSYWRWWWGHLLFGHCESYVGVSVPKVKGATPLPHKIMQEIEYCVVYYLGETSHRLWYYLYIFWKPPDIFAIDV